MNVANAYMQEARSEILRYLRNPGFLLPIILFPAAFYLMFGVALSSKTAPEAATTAGPLLSPPAVPP